MKGDLDGAVRSALTHASRELMVPRPSLAYLAPAFRGLIGAGYSPKAAAAKVADDIKSRAYEAHLRRHPGPFVNDDAKRAA